MDISITTILAALLPALACLMLAALFITLTLFVAGGRGKPRPARPVKDWATRRHGGRLA